MAAPRVLLVVRDRSIYDNDVDFQRTVRALVEVLGRHGARTDVESLLLDDRDRLGTFAARAAAGYDLVVCRLTLEGMPIAPIHALLDELEKAGVECSPRKDDALRLGSKAAVFALRDSPIGVPGTRLATNELDLLDGVASLLGESGPRCVVKSLYGCGGRGVFQIEARGDAWQATCAYDGNVVDYTPSRFASHFVTTHERALIMPYLPGISTTGEHRYYFVGDRLLRKCLLKRGSGGFSVARGLGGTRDIVDIAHREAHEWPALIARTLGLDDLPALWTTDVITDSTSRPAISETNVLNVGLRPVPLDFLDAYAEELLTRTRRRL